MNTYQTNQLWFNDIPETSCHSFVSGETRYVNVGLKWRYPDAYVAVENEMIFTSKEQIDEVITVLQKARELV